MDTKEDRLAIMRWETETGPTPGKNRRYGKRTVGQTAAKPPQTSGTGGINQGKLQMIPIVNKAAGRTVAAGAKLPLPPKPAGASVPASANGSLNRPKLPRRPS